MKVTAIKTTIVHPHDDLLVILKQALPTLQEKSVVVVTSKIVAICEGRVVPADQVDRDELVPQEADYYLPRETNPYNFCLSINEQTLIASAGIDHSNGEGNWILWPQKPQESANTIREYLSKTFNLQYVGVIITDSHLLPLRWGTHGTSIAYSGFRVLNDYRGKPDIFGVPLSVSQANVAEGMASAAVLCMGEGNEQTPLALVEDIPFVTFQDRNPTEQELQSLAISIEGDVYSPLLTSVKWIKGKN